MTTPQTPLDLANDTIRRRSEEIAKLRAQNRRLREALLHAVEWMQQELDVAHVKFRNPSLEAARDLLDEEAAG